MVQPSLHHHAAKNRFSLNDKGELIKDKGGPAKLFVLNKNLSSFNLAIAPPKKR